MKANGIIGGGGVNVRSADSVAVHGGIVEGREIDGRPNFLGEETASCFG
jgi:hypothetical protein